MLLKGNVQNREDLLPLSRLVGFQPMHQAMHALTYGPLGQLAQMVQAQKQQEDARKRWYGDQPQGVAQNPVSTVPQSGQTEGDGDMAKNWISGAIRHPGALHKDLGVPQGQKIPAKKLAAARSGKFGATTERRANLAKTLGGFKH